MSLKYSKYALAITAMTAVAVAGTPCPDPLTARVKSQGACQMIYCLFNPVGYYPKNPSVTGGGCVTPGNSAYQCAYADHLYSLVWPNASQPRDGSENGCSTPNYRNCYETTETWYGSDGWSTSAACNYGL